VRLVPQSHPHRGTTDVESIAAGAASRPRAPPQLHLRIEAFMELTGQRKIGVSIWSQTVRRGIELLDVNQAPRTDRNMPIGVVIQ